MVRGARILKSPTYRLAAVCLWASCQQLWASVSSAVKWGLFGVVKVKCEDTHRAPSTGNAGGSGSNGGILAAFFSTVSTLQQAWVSGLK